MKRFRSLTIASAVAAAFAVPAALAQQTGTTPDSSNRVQQRDATGHPSASPTQPPRSMSGDRATNDPNMRSGTVSRTDRMGSSPHGQYDARTVRDVQQALQDKGYDVGSVDGVMGPRTQSALREFQQQQGINSSGRLDQQTLGALNVSAVGANDRSGAMGSSSSRGTMRDRPAGSASTGNPGSGTIGTSPSGTAAPPTSGTMGSGGTAGGSTGSAASGPAGTGNPGSGTIGTSPSGTATPPSSSTSGSGRTGG
ncbi:MAG: peptidoglycan-binding domain-containing protein [Bacteroidota bacterium]